MDKERRSTPVEQRMTFEIDGVPQRLGWIAQNKPEFLIKHLCTGDYKRMSAILSELAKAGWDRPRIEKEAAEHPEWGADPGVLGQI